MLLRYDSSQDHINTQQDKAAIVRFAQALHALYPQYVNHWTGSEWALVRVKRDVETKLGQAFRAGDVTIAKPPLWIGGEWTVYSIRNGIDTRVQYGIERL